MPGIFYDPRVHSDWADQLGNRAVQLAQIYSNAKARAEEMQQKKDLQETDFDYKIVGNDNFPDEMRTEALNRIITRGQRNNMLQGISLLDKDFKWDSQHNKYAKKAAKIWEDPEISLEQKEKAAKGLWAEARTPGEAGYLKTMYEDIQSKKETQEKRILFAPVPIFKEAPGLATQRANLGLTGEAPQELTMGKSPAEQYLGERASLAESLVRAGMPLDKALEVAKEKKPKSPTSIEEYEYAKKQGYTGTFEDWKKTGRPTTTINLGTGTRTDLEKKVIETQSQIDAFNEMEKMFKDEYLTIPGKARAKAEVWADKLGIPISEEWLKERQRWYQMSKERFLAYRKWVTGVAGGEKEMAEIAKSYPDPDKNSPAQYRANLRQAKINAIRLQKRFKMFLDNGITPTKQQLRAIPLSQIQLTPQELKFVSQTDPYEIGAIYQDAQGRKKKYLGNGKWE